ncbi:hypothetical protein [Nocardia pseudovaccinii]|uniref:hypothetical protein n=1 Tax=Nocardia pseudovaccinii TaxID=189540 RepID=UPI000A86AD8A|nr:hypothetical protein [Nocardia pseudovaccinii]
MRELELDGEIAVGARRSRAAHDDALLDLERDRIRIDNTNHRSAAATQAQLVDSLPQIVVQLPTPGELTTYQLGGDLSGLSALIGQLTRVLETWSAARPMSVSGAVFDESGDQVNRR